MTKEATLEAWCRRCNFWRSVHLWPNTSAYIYAYFCKVCRWAWSFSYRLTLTTKAAGHAKKQQGGRSPGVHRTAPAHRPGVEAYHHPSRQAHPGDTYVNIMWGAPKCITLKTHTFQTWGLNLGVFWRPQSPIHLQDHHDTNGRCMSYKWMV